MITCNTLQPSAPNTCLPNRPSTPAPHPHLTQKFTPTAAGVAFQLAEPPNCFLLLAISQLPSKFILSHLFSFRFIPFYFIPLFFPFGQVGRYEIMQICKSSAYKPKARSPKSHESHIFHFKNPPLRVRKSQIDLQHNIPHSPPARADGGFRFLFCIRSDPAQAQTRSPLLAGVLTGVQNPQNLTRESTAWRLIETLDQLIE